MTTPAPSSRAEVTLVLALHDHQPVGNFDDVFRVAYRDSYAPFLEFLESRPELRLALHTSGPLLEWLEQHEPRYLDRLRTRVEAGQIEPWGGGFYEPILPAIPERDRRGQIAAMADWIEQRLGKRPRGLWLTERVWEPSLASSLAAAGVEYTAVDDAHFVAAGFEREALWGTFLTEDQGFSVRIFPIHRELRYLIPFGDPSEIVALLARLSAEGPGRVAVLGDDGEKFGLWPGTKKLCYENGWLERFVDAIAAEKWIRLRTPAEAVAAHAPVGLAYLPTGSYHEMQEWSLPPASQARYHAAAAALEEAEHPGSADLLRGGHWRNFLARYPESNRMHKRMLRASQRVWKDGAAHDAAWDAARTHLWRAQCNCPYWHGVFGGLYLPHLRAATYQELIAAEAWNVRGIRTEGGDLDFDGFEDALLETPDWAAWISARGGRLWGLDDRRALWNWGDTLAQRKEHYHAGLEHAAVATESGSDADPETIHSAVKLKEPGLVELVAAYRSHERDALLDHWTEGGRAVDLSQERGTMELASDAVVVRIAEGAGPAVEKRFGAAVGGGLQVDYLLSSQQDRRGTFTVEMNVAVHVAEADDRWIEVGGRRATPPAPRAVARHEGVAHAAFVDAWARRRLDLVVDPPATFERAPIETVSLSESGAERVFQGVEARLSFGVTLAPGRPWRLRVRLVPGEVAA